MHNPSPVPSPADSLSAPSRAMRTLGEWLGGLAAIAVVFAFFRSDLQAGVLSVYLLAFYMMLRMLPVQVHIGGWTLGAGLGLLAATGPPNFDYRYCELFTTIALRLDTALEFLTATAMSVGDHGSSRGLNRDEANFIARSFFILALLAGVFSWIDSPASVSEIGSRFRIAPAMGLACLGAAGLMHFRCPTDGAFALQMTILYLFVRAVPGRVRLAGWCICGLGLLCEEIFRPPAGLPISYPHWTNEIGVFLGELAREPFRTPCEPPGAVRYSPLPPMTVQAFGSFLVALLATAISAVNVPAGLSAPPGLPNPSRPSILAGSPQQEPT